MRSADVLAIVASACLISALPAVMTLALYEVKYETPLGSRAWPSALPFSKLAVVAVIAGGVIRAWVGRDEDSHRQVGRCMLGACAAAPLACMAFCAGGWRWVLDGAGR